MSRLSLVCWASNKIKATDVKESCFQRSIIIFPNLIRSYSNSYSFCRALIRTIKLWFIIDVFSIRVGTCWRESITFQDSGLHEKREAIYAKNIESVLKMVSLSLSLSLKTVQLLSNQDSEFEDVFPDWLWTIVFSLLYNVDKRLVQN